MNPPQDSGGVTMKPQAGRGWGGVPPLALVLKPAGSPPCHWKEEEKTRKPLLLSSSSEEDSGPKAEQRLLSRGDQN